MAENGIVRRTLNRFGLYLTAKELVVSAVSGITGGGVVANAVSGLTPVSQGFFAVATTIVVFYAVAQWWQRTYGARVAFLFDDDEPGPTGIVVVQNNGPQADFSVSAEIVERVGGDPNPVRQTHFTPPWMSANECEQSIPPDGRAQIEMASTKHPDDLEEHSPEWFEWSELLLWQLKGGERVSFQSRKWNHDDDADPPAFVVDLTVTRAGTRFNRARTKRVVVKGGELGGVFVTPAEGRRQ